MGEGTSAAQPDNNNGAPLFNELLPSTSKREKPDEPLFCGPLCQISTSRIAALILEEPMPALNNLYNQFFFYSLKLHPNICGNANENERPLMSGLILSA